VRSVETVLFLVVLATVVATFARRLRVPAPSLLVVAGVGVGLIPGVPAVGITPEVVSLIVLPPLLFAAGEELPWRDLRAVWRPVAVLAVGLVVGSAVAVGAVAILLTSMPVSVAFVLGAILASTDPVAVTALARRLSLPPRVQALVQAESLFNDATSLLLFRLALSLAISVSVSWRHAVSEFAMLAVGGVLVGAFVALGAYLIRSRTEDPVLETVVALVTPYGAYVLAEAISASGVTAVVVASVVLGTQATRLTTSHIRLQLGAVSETVVFLLESVVFGLIGLQLPALIRQLEGTDPKWPLYALAIAATLIVVRLLWVFPLSAVLQRRRGARPSWRVPAVVSWAGARGVVPLAAALSLPLGLPDREMLLLLTTAVIVITLVVQGFTLAPLVRRAGIALDPVDVRQEHQNARLHLARTGLSHLEQLAEAETAPEFVVDQLRHSWQARISRIENHDVDDPDSSAGAAYLRLRRELLDVEGTELTHLYETGVISDMIRRRIQRQLDLEHTGLDDD
jgi:Na+/H+ antiporter